MTRITIEIASFSWLQYYHNEEEAANSDYARAFLIKKWRPEAFDKDKSHQKRDVKIKNGWRWEQSRIFEVLTYRYLLY